jgi:hypothetical protein
MDWLKKHGCGIHHIAVKLKDDYDMFMEKYKAEDKNILVEVLNGNGNRGFTFLDTFNRLGFNIEIHK